MIGERRVAEEDVAVFELPNCYLQEEKEYTVSSPQAWLCFLLSVTAGLSNTTVALRTYQGKPRNTLGKTLSSLLYISRAYMAVRM